MPEPPDGNSSFSSKLGPIPLKHFDNDFPSKTADDKLSPEQEAIVAAVLAQHPTLTREEAIQHLREMGM